MSNWTHVAGIVRIDYIKWEKDPELDFDEIIGKECLFDSDREIWTDAHNNPNDYLPMGSEGSLQKSIWINPDKCSLPRYTVSIFGDLRDHDNPQEIIDWFKKLCNKLENSVRNAVITASNEVFGDLTWSWEESIKEKKESNMQNLNCINNLKNKDRYKNFTYFDEPIPFNETPVFSDKYKVIQLNDINIINGNIVGFCGLCKVKNGDVIPLDGDSYYKEMQTVGYEEFTDKEGNLCLDLLVDSW